jgi:hypothetical protein
MMFLLGVLEQKICSLATVVVPPLATTTSHLEELASHGNTGIGACSQLVTNTHAV